MGTLLARPATDVAEESRCEVGRAAVLGGTPAVDLRDVSQSWRRSAFEYHLDPEIALSVGLSDHSHLARHFRRFTGMTPSAAR